MRSLRRLLRSIAGPIQPPAAPGLHHCRGCGRDMVCPLDWHAIDDDHWEIELRCGECGLWRQVVATNAQAADFDIALCGQESAIARDLSSIEALGPGLIHTAAFAR
jgi:hypothetical protein